MLGKLFNNTIINYNYLKFSKYTTSSRIKDLSSTRVGEHINVQGWIKAIRKMKENVFLDISDGSCDKKLQIVLSSNVNNDALNNGASVEIKGVLNKSPKGDLELHADTLHVCGKCNLSEGYPFAPRKIYTEEYIRQYLHLRSRTNQFASLLRVRDGLQRTLSEYLHKNGYIQVHTPILTSNDCEGAGEIFSISVENKNLLKEMVKSNVDIQDAYFDKKVYLTVSGQLHLEAISHGLTKVYTFGPTFRAENSNTRLHLSEFYMLEVEKAFTNNLGDLTTLVEDLIKNVTEEIFSKYMEDIIRCTEGKTDTLWFKKKFVTLDYEEAVKIVMNKKDQFNVPFNAQKGFSKEHELFLVNYNDGAPTFIINWPKLEKPFYMKECLHDSSKVAAFDLLTPLVGELVGGSLREDNYDKLKTRVPTNKNSFDWYLDIRKYGGVSTGGFGLGFERYLILLLGINNIKDTIPFPRWPHNCKL